MKPALQFMDVDITDISKEVSGLLVSHSFLHLTFNRELNYLRMNYRFEKIKLFHCMNFK